MQWWWTKILLFLPRELSVIIRTSNEHENMIRCFWTGGALIHKNMAFASDQQGQLHQSQGQWITSLVSMLGVSRALCVPKAVIYSRLTTIKGNIPESKALVLANCTFTCHVKQVSRIGSHYKWWQSFCQTRKRIRRGSDQVPAEISRHAEFLYWHLQFLLLIFLNIQECRFSTWDFNEWVKS